MAAKKFVHLEESKYLVSIIQDVREGDLNTEYEVGCVSSDLMRNVYQIQGACQSPNRKLKVTFDDILFGSRQVSIEVNDDRKAQSERFKNVPASMLSVFNKEM
jgi:uncharacterized protein (DUF2141 family)